MAGLGVKNGHQKDMQYDEIGLCAQHIDNILCSVVNITNGGAYVILKRESDSSLWILIHFASLV